MDSAAPFQPWASSDGSKNVKSENEIVDDAKHHRENVNHPKHQTASYEQESYQPTRINPGPSSTAGSEGDSSTTSKEAKMDNSKISSMQQIVENTLSSEGRQRVVQILEAVDALSSAERLLLYLRLPTGMPPHDPLKQPINPLGSRAELQQTVTWIKSHLEVDPDVSLPKQDVYDDYIAHCMSCNMKPLSTADFGKVMKQVYPSVRPRRLGTRGNSRYCYAGLRKKIKLEVPQLPDLGESSKEIGAIPKESERIVCEWAEAKLGIKFASIRELSRHIASLGTPPTRPLRPSSGTPPPLVSTHHGPSDDSASRQLMKQLKRKIQGQGTPGRPKKNKEVQDSPPSTSYLHHPAHPLLPLKHEEVPPPDPYAYPPQYLPIYEAPRYISTRPHPIPGEPYREPYPYEPPYAHREPEPTLNLPINLSADTSLDLSTDRARPPPEPSPPKPHQRFPPLPGKKLILETYQSEQAGSPRQRSADEYLPKKMRAAEILGGKLAAARHHAEPEPPPSDEAFAAPRPLPPAASTEEYPPRPEGAFLEDPKNATRRSKSTAAALARERQDAASPTTPAADLDHINIKNAICEERHSELFHRERVISICNIDKHDLDDYLNEGSSQDHEEELLQYFHKENTSRADATPFLETGLDPPDDRAQGKIEKLSQLRKLLAKNLKNQIGSGSNQPLDPQTPLENDSGTIKPAVSEGAFKPVVAGSGPDIANGNVNGNTILADGIKQRDQVLNKSEPSRPYENDPANNQAMPNVPGASLYNGNCANVPQSPTTRTQQYDFVPISDRCHSPGNFSQRGNSPSKVNQPNMGGSLQTSPISHSATVSPFVSPRNTPVPRSRVCSRPIPKHTGKRYRRAQLTLGVPCNPRQFTAPNEQKFMNKSAMYQPMSAPPSPNILTSQYRNHMFPCNPLPNGINTSGMNNFLPNVQLRETMNGDLAQPLSADPLSSEISQFFQDPVGTYRVEHENSFRSQSVPLKQGLNNMCMLSYNNTPAGSVPPTPIPNEFSDFGSLTDTCDISKAGLNPETLVKIYNAIDSSVVLNGGTDTLLNTNDALVNGCDSLSDQPMLTDDHLNSLIPGGDPMLNRDGQFSGEFGVQVASSDNVEDYLKRTNIMEMPDLSEIVEKNKYYSSRSVPSTPLPYKRIPNLHIDPRRSRELFVAEHFNNAANGISSKSVPSTPQLNEDRSMFSYSNRDFLINGNSVDACSTQVHGPSVDNSQSLTSSLEMCDDIADSLPPDTDLLPELDVNLDI